jgi:hypothetical protein
VKVFYFRFAGAVRGENSRPSLQQLSKVVCWDEGDVRLSRHGYSWVVVNPRLVLEASARQVLGP